MSNYAPPVKPQQRQSAMRQSADVVPIVGNDITVGLQKPTGPHYNTQNERSQPLTEMVKSSNAPVAATLSNSKTPIITNKIRPEFSTKRNQPGVTHGQTTQVQTAVNLHQRKTS